MGKSLLSAIVLFFVLFFLVPQSAHAIKYSLIQPSGNLSRGQQIQFIVTINTQGQSVTNAVVGMTYDTEFLQYISTTPGDAMSSISASPQNTGELLLTGTNSSGFTGTGDFAFVTFKIIADEPGETELCSLFAPNTTPTPTTPAGLTPAPTNTPTLPPGVTPTVTIAPTSLPRSGSAESTMTYLFTGLGFIGLFTTLHFLSQNKYHKRK